MKHTIVTGKNTKEQIFLAAAALFADGGYNGISIKDIAQKVGIQPSSIYNHFSGKEEIIDELLEYYLFRMEFFYEKLANTEIDVHDTKDLDIALNKLMLAYDEGEKYLMYQLTRIVHHEQFHYKKAAEALIGEGYKKYAAAHIHFFNRLSEKGLISGENNYYYGELYARLSLTFGTQFLHPEIAPTIAEQAELGAVVNKLLIAYETNVLAQKQGSE